MLKAILVGFQNKKRRAIQKASFILENTYVIMNSVSRNIKGAFGEVSNGKKELTIGS